MQCCRIFRLLLFWLSTATSYSEALSLLDDSVLRCKQKIDAGLYHAEAKIVFLTANAGETQAVLEHALIRRHPQVACLQRLDGGRRMGLFRRWGFVASWPMGEIPKDFSKMVIPLYW